MLDTVQKIINQIIVSSKLEGFNPNDLENSKITDRGDHYVIVIKDFIRDFDKINNLATDDSINKLTKEYFDSNNNNKKLLFKSISTHKSNSGKDYKYYNLKIDDKYELGKQLDWISIKFILNK